MLYEEARGRLHAGRGAQRARRRRGRGLIGIHFAPRVFLNPRLAVALLVERPGGRGGWGGEARAVDIAKRQGTKGR